MYYPPEMGAPQARLSDLARRLYLQGHEVQVISAIPNYPTGKIFPGWAKSYVFEKLAGIPVHRCWVLPSNKPQLLPRLISYLSFCLSSFIVGLKQIDRHHIVITESPPLFVALFGWLMSAVKGARWILNVSDLWPDSAKHIGMIEERSLTYRMLRSLAHGLYQRAWLITGQSKEIVDEIEHQVPGVSTYHFSNGVDTEKFTPELWDEGIRQKYLLEGETGFVYAGLHGLFQGLDQIICAAQALKEAPIRFLFFGDGPEKNSLMQRAKELGLEKINFFPPVPHDQVPAILASMDVAIISLKSYILGAVPSKIYEAMASGIPVLLIAEGESQLIVDKAKAGFAIVPGDINGLIQTIRQLASEPQLRQEMGRAGRGAAATTYDRAGIVGKFIEKICRMESIQVTEGCCHIL